MIMQRLMWPPIAFICFILSGCGGHSVPPKGHLTHSHRVVVQLKEQLKQWQGTPYRDGGSDRHGIDCSGFVWRTFRDRFDIPLPRTTSAQTELGTSVARDRLMPGDLVFFKTGRGKRGLHVGIYHTDDKFIHASTSRGVTRSSLNNVYWKKTYWQARRI